MPRGRLGFFDNLARVLHANPKFLRARSREANAEIEQLRAHVAEQDAIIKSIAMTLRYSHLAPNHLAEAAAVMDRIASGPAKSPTSESVAV